MSCSCKMKSMDFKPSLILALRSLSFVVSVVVAAPRRAAPCVLTSRPPCAGLTRSTDRQPCLFHSFSLRILRTHTVASHSLSLERVLVEVLTVRYELTYVPILSILLPVAILTVYVLSLEQRFFMNNEQNAITFPSFHFLWLQRTIKQSIQ